LLTLSALQRPPVAPLPPPWQPRFELKRVVVVVVVVVVVKRRPP